jgi:hypothetical protein
MSYKILTLPKYLKQNKLDISRVSLKSAVSNFNLSAWQQHFNADLTVRDDLATIYNRFGGSIERKHIIQLAKESLGLKWPNIRLLFLAIMIWGYGDWQIGKIYTRNIFAGETARSVIASAIELVSVNQIEKAYCGMQIPYFGPAYFTKLLYFVGRACNIQPLPLILDKNVAKCLDFIDDLEQSQLLSTFVPVTRDRNGIVNSVRNDMTGYMNYIYSLDSWAKQLGCPADHIECFLYDDRGKARHSNKSQAKGTAMIQQQSIVLPMSSSPIKGVLWPQTPGDPDSPWEFAVLDTKRSNEYGVNINEVNKLPGFPHTKKHDKKRDPGVECTLIDKNEPKNSCTAAFHGYHKGDCDGPGFYIGSAQRLLGNGHTKLYRGFLEAAFHIIIGSTTQPIRVWMDFKNNNTIFVWKR